MTYEVFKSILLSNPEAKKEYDALEPEYQLIMALLKLREEQNLTQQELSERTGINRADISKIEHANANPSLSTLKRLASAFGKRLQITFV